MRGFFVIRNIKIMSAERITYTQLGDEWTRPGITDSYYSVGGTPWHFDNLYGLKQPSGKVCTGNGCDKPAVAFLFTRQHDGETWINVFCETHLPKSWANELDKSRKEIVSRGNNNE